MEWERWPEGQHVGRSALVVVALGEHVPIPVISGAQRQAAKQTHTKLETAKVQLLFHGSVARQKTSPGNYFSCTFSTLCTMGMSRPSSLKTTISPTWYGASCVHTRQGEQGISGVGEGGEGAQRMQGQQILK